MRLQNETAIVTGGTSGIGKKITQLFLQEGCKVAICSRNESNVVKTVDEFRIKFRDKILGFPCDVADTTSVKIFVDRVASQFGSVRILVANAGLAGLYGPFANIPYDQLGPNIDAVIGTILRGTLNTISAVLPHMIKQKYGRIVALSGGGADRPLTHMTTYSAAKGGVVAFSKCLALELAVRSEDIKINIYQPGMLRTGLTSHSEIVPGWLDPDTVHKQSELALQYLGGDLEVSTHKVLPYVLPSCKQNGTSFRGFSVRKLIRGAMRLKKVQKTMAQDSKK
jgi:NAD(P)-dependent dehydrogenase (short-subunit alcohol dehydrogenase family)